MVKRHFLVNHESCSLDFLGKLLQRVCDVLLHHLRECQHRILSQVQEKAITSEWQCIFDKGDDWSLIGQLAEVKVDISNVWRQSPADVKVNHVQQGYIFPPNSEDL